MAGYINSTINETSSSTGKASPQAQQGHKVNKALKALKDQKPGLHMIVRIFPIVSKMFRRSGRSYGNATQTIAKDPDD